MKTIMSIVDLDVMSLYTPVLYQPTMAVLTSKN